jgi:hypothetical protein
MDIEGYEWDVLASLGMEEGWESALPLQMAIEFHVEQPYYQTPAFMNESHFSK